MTDIVYIGLLLGFVAITLAVAFGCRRLQHDRG